MNLEQGCPEVLLCSTIDRDVRCIVGVTASHTDNLLGH
jgi:hypothetical protein